MNWISDKERLLKLAYQSQTDIFTSIDKKCDSYWKEEEISECLIDQYQFETPVEYRKAMAKFVNDEELLTILVAASFKNRNIRDKETLVEVARGGDMQLPEYVYYF